jgi:hypothetical protein
MAPDQNMYGQEGREKERERATNHAKNRVGQYILGTEIGKGSFATVYKGYIQVSCTDVGKEPDAHTALRFSIENP